MGLYEVNIILTDAALNTYVSGYKMQKTELS